MAFTSRGWFPVAVVLSALNLFAAGVYARSEGGLHPTIHLLLAVGFGLWAVRIRSRPRFTATGELPAHLDSIEAQVDGLRQELIETQERLDFAERMLSQRAEAQREPVERQERSGPE